MDQADVLDIIVIGGGITGAGIAREAAHKGFSVALFDKGDFAVGTSSKSSKLVHGGLRYLKTYEFSLVYESVSERYVQQQIAPHLVQPLPFLVPISQGNKPGLFVMNIGLWIYDLLALLRAPRRHKTFRSAKKILDLEPKLRGDELKGGIEYYDCATDDARLVLENVLDAIELGADCRSYHRVDNVARLDSGIKEVTFTDCLTGEQGVARARCVISATGPWTDEANRALELSPRKQYLRATKGCHLVFPREALPLERTVTIISPVDERVMFAIPWRDRTVVGTTDTDYEGAVEDCNTTAEDAAYLCASANEYFPEANLTPDDAISSWAGLRPLLRDDQAESESAVSREHDIFVGDDGVILIAGGKLTTYRLMAKQCVRAAQRWLFHNHRPRIESLARVTSSTHKRPLPGAMGLDDAGLSGVGASLVAELGVSQHVAEHIANTYGVRAKHIIKMCKAEPDLAETLEDDLPFMWAEIVFACRFDRVRTLADILCRRVPLILCGRTRGTAQLDRAAQLAARELAWDDSRTKDEISEYQRLAADAIAFKATSVAPAETKSAS